MEVLEYPTATEILDLPPEGNDSMTVPKPAQRFELVEDRLDKIEATLENGLPKNSTARAYQWAINHKGTSLILAVILCVAGAYFTYWLDHRNDGFNDAVDARIAKVLSSPGGVNETLKEVRDTTKLTLPAQNVSLS